MALSPKGKAWQFLNCRITTNAFLQSKLQQILLFLLVHGLTTILLVGGLADEDRQNGLRHVPIVLHVICLCGVGQNTATDQNQEHLIHWNNKLAVLLIPLLLTSCGKVMSLCLTNCLIMGKIVGPVLKCDTGRKYIYFVSCLTLRL